MKTGDATSTVWLEGLRHSYCCEVNSERRPYTSKRVRYFWHVEQWSECYPDIEVEYETKPKAARTLEAAIRLARRMAEYLERKRMEKDRGTVRKLRKQ